MSKAQGPRSKVQDLEPRVRSQESGIRHLAADTRYPQSGQKLEFTIEGMDCGDCARTIEKAVAGLPGVQTAAVNFGAARLSVMPANGTLNGMAAAIERKVGEAGYRATPLQRRNTSAEAPFWRRDRRVLTTAVGAIFALVAFMASLFGAPSWLISSLFGVTIVVSGLGFARAGLLSLRVGRADMNLLMSVAAATVVLLFAFGGTLQAYTLQKTRGAIKSLMDLSPSTALVRRSDRSTGLPIMREMRVAVDEVLAGETVLVGHGERVPLDGVVLTGTSSVDQSSITGESVPVDVEPGSEVYAGTINGPGALSFRATSAVGDTTLARIIGMVEEAQARRAPSQQFVERFSAVYTPLVIAGAALVALVPPLLLGQPFADWVYRALVLLVVACPCALVISTPVSIVAAIGAATRHGVLIKGGDALETLGKIRVIAFDKTGTLTEGRPQVVAVRAADGDEDKLLVAAAVAEARSEHPLARAVVHAARDLRNGSPAPEATDFTALPGLGARAEVGGQAVYVGSPRLFREEGIALNGLAHALDALDAEGNTSILVGTHDGVQGIIALADKPRPGAKEAIEELRRAGVRHIAMLTGDNRSTAEAIARQLGADSCHAELLPAEKVDAVRRIAAEHGPLAMVGDGVNDAPALATASVGIAMGIAGTDAALEVAEVALMSDDLSRLPYALTLSRKTLAVIKTNIGVSLATKAVALALASAGMLPLWGAIMADMGVSLLVTLNGMRLLGYKG
jgi:Cd2+/Zn2+-exporting ATPase